MEPHRTSPGGLSSSVSQSRRPVSRVRLGLVATVWIGQAQAAWPSQSLRGWSRGHASKRCVGLALRVGLGSAGGPRAFCHSVTSRAPLNAAQGGYIGLPSRSPDPSKTFLQDMHRHARRTSCAAREGAPVGLLGNRRTAPARCRSQRVPDGVLSVDAGPTAGAGVFRLPRRPPVAVVQARAAPAGWPPLIASRDHPCPSPLILASRVDEFLARKQRKELGLCEACGGTYQGDPAGCPRADCPCARRG